MWCVMGPKWCVMGAEWFIMGPKRYIMGPQWCIMGPKWCVMGPKWCIIGHKWCAVGPQWCVMDPKWCIIGPFFPWIRGIGEEKRYQNKVFQLRVGGKWRLQMGFFHGLVGFVRKKCTKIRCFNGGQEEKGVGKPAKLGVSTATRRKQEFGLRG